MCSVQPGQQLDHYNIESVFAHSGMNTIFRGTDSRSGRLESGVMKMKTITGDDVLITFLGVELGIRPEGIDAVIEELKRENNANLFDCELPDDTLAKLGLP